MAAKERKKLKTGTANLSAFLCAKWVAVHFQLYGQIPNIYCEAWV